MTLKYFIQWIHSQQLNPVDELSPLLMVTEYTLYSVCGDFIFNSLWQKHELIFCEHHSITITQTALNFSLQTSI